MGYYRRTILHMRLRHLFLSLHDMSAYRVLFPLPIGLMCL